MRPLGPWPASGAGPPIAIAVSGGADSLCLALLAARWARPRDVPVLALVVDHRLRPESSREASETCARLSGHGIAATVLCLDGLAPGPGLAERARIARYHALTAACRAAGAIDLLLGHHAGDQAETVLLRTRAGSGPDGLAGIAALVETDALRLVRPLLTVPPERLRATLDAAATRWIEDPSNQDRRAERTRLRQELAAAPGRPRHLLEQQAIAAAARSHARHQEAACLARGVTLRPEGFAILPPDLVPAGPLAALIRTISGRPYRPSPDAVQALLNAPRAATLSGTRLIPAGRLGPGWLLIREFAAVAPPTRAWNGVCWDRRFVLHATTLAPGTTIGALGPSCSGLRRHSDLPAAVLRTLPCLRTADGALLCVPHLCWRATDAAGQAPDIAFRPAAPATDAALFATA